MWAFNLFWVSGMLAPVSSALQPLAWLKEAAASSDRPEAFLCYVSECESPSVRLAKIGHGRAMANGYFLCTSDIDCGLRNTGPACASGFHQGRGKWQSG